MNYIKQFLIKTNDINKSSYTWNMIGSMINALQSVFFLMILTRVLGIDDAGIFSIAYADANLFLNLGKYGMRYYQVSDYNRQFSFGEYTKSRFFTTFLMGIFSAAYVIVVGIINEYTYYKEAIILCTCIWKMADSIEDVYLGDLQSNGRLDIAGKIMTVRTISMIAVWAMFLLMTRNLLITTAGATAYTFICLFFLLNLSKEYYSKSKVGEIYKDSAGGKGVGALLKAVFPLFVSSFLAFYIGNASKYAIDRQLTDIHQAYYGFIAMPVFVIGLINSFIFNPIITSMTILWNEGRTVKFVKRSLQQFVIVFGITLACVIGAFFMGIPVLSFLYHTDLSEYRTDLLLMLFGGGFLGFSSVLSTLITIQRTQKYLMIGYASVAFVAMFFSNSIVKMFGIRGAVLLYVGLMAVLSLEFSVVFICGMHRKC